MVGCVTPVRAAPETRMVSRREKLIATHKFGTEQLQWLSLVREQLIKNLTLYSPLIHRRRGQGRGGLHYCTRPWLGTNQIVSA